MQKWAPKSWDNVYGCFIYTFFSHFSFFFVDKKLKLCVLLLLDVDPCMPLVSSNTMEGSDIQELLNYYFVNKCVSLLLWIEIL